MTTARLLFGFVIGGTTKDGFHAFSGARDALLPIAAPAQSEDLTTSLLELAKNPDQMAQLGSRAQQRALDISWGAIGRQTAGLYKSLLSH